MDDNTTPEAAQTETWPMVWAKYWNPLSDDEVRRWDEELAATFGKDDQGREDVTEPEVCDAIRQLGARADYQNYRPKIGAVIHLIRNRKESRKKEQEALVPERKGFISCLYCKDSGWITIEYNRVVVDGRIKKQLPDVVTHTATDPENPSGVIEYKGFSRTDYRMSVPCLLCGKGSKYVREGMHRSTLDFEKKYSDWLKALPDDCIDKPKALRLRRDLPLITRRNRAGVEVLEDANAVEESWE